MPHPRSLASALALTCSLGWVACGGSARLGVSGGATGEGGASSGSTGATSSGGTSVASSSSSSGSGGPTCTPTCSGGGCCMLVKQFGGPGVSGFGQAIVADPVTGDIVVSGGYKGPLDLGMGPLPWGGPQTPGGFLARYDANGAPIWTKGWAVPASLSRIVAAGPDLVGVGADLAPLASGCGAGAAGGGAVVKLAGDGSCIWWHAMPAGASAVAVDGNQDLVVVGRASAGPLPDFGCGPEATTGFEGFVAKLRGSDGACVWSHLFPSSIIAEGPQCALAVDASSAVYVGSAFTGMVGFAGQTLTSVSVNGDALLLKYDDQGSEVWARSWGSATFPWTESWVDGIAVTKDQRVWITGAYDQGVTFGSHAFGEAPWSGYVAGLTPDGDLVTAVSLTSAGDTAQGHGVMLVDSAGALVTARGIDGNSDPQGCTLTVGSDVVNGCGTLLSTLDPAAGLAPKWARSLGMALGDNGYSSPFISTPLALDGCDDILITGQVGGATDVGCGTMMPLGDGDFFFARLAR